VSLRAFEFSDAGGCVTHDGFARCYKECEIRLGRGRVGCRLVNESWRKIWNRRAVVHCGSWIGRVLGGKGRGISGVCCVVP
jgi:hypothetical protein